jgi:hypothetical protein
MSSTETHGDVDRKSVHEGELADPRALDVFPVYGRTLQEYTVSA